MTRSRPHIVQQGEYLTKLAARHGVDESTLWSHAKNKELSDLRPHPNMLAPGDVIYVPDAAKKWLALSVGGENTVNVNVPKVRVSPRFMHDGKPIVGRSYVIEGVAAPRGATDDKGCVHVMVPTTVSEFVIVFPEQEETYRVRVGHLDPPTTRSGARQRLGALGYYGRPGGSRPVEGADEELGFGLVQFQAEHGVDVTGELDAATIAKLVEVYKC